MTQASLSTSINLDSDLNISNYDEAVEGDISNEPDKPSELILSPGTTTLSASTGNEDQEFLTVVIPDGFQLDSLVLESFSPERNVAFIGVQEGDSFTEPLDRSADVRNLLGYDLFGEPRQIGTDILDDLGEGFDAIGFEGALPSGEYTFALRQAGVVSDYTLAFNVSEASEPSEVENRDNDDLLAFGSGDRLVGADDTDSFATDSGENFAAGSEDVFDLAGLEMSFQNPTLTDRDSNESTDFGNDWTFFQEGDFTNFGADDFAFG